MKLDWIVANGSLTNGSLRDIDGGPAKAVTNVPHISAADAAKAHFMNRLGRVQTYLAFLCVQSDLSWQVVRIIIRREGKIAAYNWVSPSYSVALDENCRTPYKFGLVPPKLDSAPRMSGLERAPLRRRRC